jgi:hypothetical protein
MLRGSVGARQQELEGILEFVIEYLRSRAGPQRLAAWCSPLVLLVHHP